MFTLVPPNYSIWIVTHLKLCLADAIHNFKWVEIIQIWQNGDQLFSNIADWCHILPSHVWKVVLNVLIQMKTRIYAAPAVKGLNHAYQRVSQFEIIINVLVSSSCLIWIPMLWVFNHYKCFNNIFSFSAGTVFIRQSLTYKDVRFWRIKTVPALKGLRQYGKHMFN